MISLVGIFSGCAGSQDDATSTAESLSNSIDRTVGLAFEDNIPNQYNTKLDIIIVRSTINSERPARLKARLSNTADEEQTYSLNPNPPLGQLTSKNGPGQLLLVEANRAERESSECWRISAPQHGDGRTEIMLASNESIENTLDIWDASEESCFPTGEYIFSPAIRLNDQYINYEFALKITTQ